MLYLEDFLELIEQLPSELRDRFTELRTLDLEVQNALDRNEEHIERLFQSGPALSSEDRSRYYEKIKEEYKKILENADDKVSIANTMYDLVERYQRRLEGELSKFKLELEVDNPGITENLEQKVRESEQRNKVLRRDRKRKMKEYGRRFSNEGSTASPSPTGSREDRHLGAVGHAGWQGGTPRRSQTYPHRLSDIRALNSSASVSATNVVGRVVPVAGPSTANPSVMSSFIGSESRHGRPRKITSRVQEMLKETMQRQERQRHPTFSNGDSDDDEQDDGGDDDTQDTDQRKWCICNQPSFGEMVACDNAECPFEWFHYECVEITQPPKGKWFCPHCTETMKRRKLLQPAQ